jgi:hypothetical protein
MPKTVAIAVTFQRNGTEQNAVRASFDSATQAITVDKPLFPSELSMLTRLVNVARSDKYHCRRSIESQE